MFCGKCGATISDQATFCPECGTPVVNGAVSPGGVGGVNGGARTGASGFFSRFRASKAGASGTARSRRAAGGSFALTARRFATKAVFLFPLLVFVAAFVLFLVIDLSAYDDLSNELAVVDKAVAVLWTVVYVLSGLLLIIPAGRAAVVLLVGIAKNTDMPRRAASGAIGWGIACLVIVVLLGVGNLIVENDLIDGIEEVAVGLPFLLESYGGLFVPVAIALLLAIVVLFVGREKLLTPRVGRVVYPGFTPSSATPTRR